ncbi:50S ribosomal protein L6 [Candidatus Bathyarchaeota archaeon]|nr:MAG: 50S ribosomal protein L6 [Candidatus Bathyarchaeota archaeon]
MTVQIVENTLEIPENVDLALNGYKVAVTGSNGNVERDFEHTRVNLNYVDRNLRIWVENPKKKQASLVKTISSHVQNMIKGVTEGYIYRLKIVFIHFPMTIQIQGKKVIINNFVGEQRAREAKIFGDVSVRVEGDDIIVQGVNIEEVAQTAANIQQATKIRNKDLRKFLDGIYVYRKE